MPTLPSLPSGLRLPRSGPGLILLIVGALILACICVVAYLWLGGSDDSTDTVYDAPASTSSQVADAAVPESSQPFVPCHAGRMSMSTVFCNWR